MGRPARAECAFTREQKWFFTRAGVLRLAAHSRDHFLHLNAAAAFEDAQANAYGEKHNRQQQKKDEEHYGIQHGYCSPISTTVW
jgi:hypothetical protein